MATKKKIPEIRFKGFEGEWKATELGNEVDFFSGLTYSPSSVISSGGTFVLRSSNIKNGEVVDADNVYVDSNVVNCDNVRIGDLAIVVRNGSRSLIGKHAQIKKQMDNTVIGAFMTGIHSKQPAFINSLLDTNQFDKEIEKNLGATINQITTGAFKRMRFWFPNILDEQAQIGTYFQNLDSLISLHQRKYDKLLTVKKAMLEKMFPKEGADVPEIRFKGFEGKWEEKTLEQGSSKIGDGLHGTPQYVDNGGVFFINGNNLISGEVVINNETKQVSVYEQSKNDKSLDENTILMSINGTIGNLAYYKNEKIMLGKSVAYITLNNINKIFLYGYLQTACIQNHFTNNLTGSTIKNLGLKTIRETEILLPEIDEQTKIGTFFQNLDTQISQHQKQLEKLKNVKKACLEKMFV